jgi:ankyrin repeat protein
MAKGRKEFHGIPAASREWALVSAAATGNIKAMKGLIADGVDTNALRDGHTALHEAARLGRLKSVELLIESGGDLNAPNKEGSTPLMTACLAGLAKGSKIALALLEAGADATIVRDDEMTALKFAVKRSEPAVLEALLAAGAEIDGPPGTDQTALMLAARANNVESLKILIAAGADPTLPCGLPWAENRTAEGLAEFEKQRAALAYLHGLRG